MVVDKRLHRFRIQQLVYAGLGVHEPPPDKVDTLALEPARIGCRKTLLGALGDLRWDVSGHHFSQQQLAITGFLEVTLALSTGLVFIEGDNLGEIAELGGCRKMHREVDEI